MVCPFVVVVMFYPRVDCVWIESKSYFGKCQTINKITLDRHISAWGLTVQYGYSLDRQTADSINIFGLRVYPIFPTVWLLGNKRKCWLDWVNHKNSVLLYLS